MLDLFAAGDEVLQLLTHPGWRHVQRVIELAQADTDEMLDGRLLDSRADYARAHGRRSGFRSMTEAARAIVATPTKLAEAAQQARSRGRDRVHVRRTTCRQWDRDRQAAKVPRRLRRARARVRAARGRT
jgi:hypothetical protein